MIGIVTSIVVAVISFYLAYSRVFGPKPKYYISILLVYFPIVIVNHLTLLKYFVSIFQKKLARIGLATIIIWLFYKIVFLLHISGIYKFESEIFKLILNIVYPLSFVIFGVLITLKNWDNTFLRIFGIFMAIFHTLYITIWSLELNLYYQMKMLKSIMPIILVSFFYSGLQSLNRIDTEIIDSDLT